MAWYVQSLVAEPERPGQTMPICATCGQPLDAPPLQRACPSCTWRAALRASKAVAAENATTPQATARTETAKAADAPAALELPVVDHDPLELMERLFRYAAATGDDLGDASARIYLALLRGNSRPYATEINRLVARFIDRLEDTWSA
jgi:hypothetical protein